MQRHVAFLVAGVVTAMGCAGRHPPAEVFPENSSAREWPQAHVLARQEVPGTGVSVLAPPAGPLGERNPPLGKGRCMEVPPLYERAAGRHCVWAGKVEPESVREMGVLVYPGGTHVRGPASRAADLRRRYVPPRAGRIRESRDAQYPDSVRLTFVVEIPEEQAYNRVSLWSVGTCVVELHAAANVGDPFAMGTLFLASAALVPDTCGT